jgi:hypothetical protein
VSDCDISLKKPSSHVLCRRMIVSSSSSRST